MHAKVVYASLSTSFCLLQRVTIKIKDRSLRGSADDKNGDGEACCNSSKSRCFWANIVNRIESCVSCGIRI